MDFKETIRQCGMKATPGRVILLEQLYRANEPLSYEDIRPSVSVDKATFYRSMAAFEEKGIVSGFEFPDKRRYYEYRRNDHGHFICLKCGGVECLHSNMFSMPGYAIETLIVKGTCKACNV